MDDRFLQRSKAKLAVAELLGILGRWIRRSLREISDVELRNLGVQFQKRVRELALVERPDWGVPSMGARMRIWGEHPFKKYLDAEQALRSDEMERNDPETYWGMHYYYNFSREEAEDFVSWCWSKGRCFHKTPGCHSLKEHLGMWLKQRKKPLPVLSPSLKANLPSNAYGQRPSEVKAHGETPTEAEESKDSPQIGGEDSLGRFPIEDLEVHKAEE